MAMLVEPLGLTTPVAGFNGGMFVLKPPDHRLRAALGHRR
jgi:hypothetical protein